MQRILVWVDLEVELDDLLVLVRFDFDNVDDAEKDL